ncbi:hypothetical protein ABPG74_002808 [Tetrahymena malaccensis]
MEILNSRNSYNLSEGEVFLLNNYKKCPLHPSRQLIIINIQEDQNYCLKCVDCISYEPIKRAIPLISLLESKNKTIFKGWPILDDQKIYQQLIEISSKESYVEETQKKINSYFKELRSSIDFVIQEKELEMLKQTEFHWDVNQKIIEVYNEHSCKQELKDIILNKFNNFEQQNQLIKEIIGKTIKNQDILKQKMSDQLSSLKNQPNRINLCIPNQIKECIIKYIKDIDVFVERSFEDIHNKEIQQNLHFYQNDLSKIQPQNMTTSQLIVKLINNKFNFCSQELIEKLNFVIASLAKRIDNFKINDHINQEILNLDKLSQNSLQNITDLIEFELYETNQQEGQEQQKQISENINRIIQQLQLKIDQMKKKEDSQIIKLNQIENLKNHNTSQYVEIDLSSLSNSDIGQDKIDEFEKTLEKCANITNFSINLSNPSIQKQQIISLLKSLRSLKQINSLNINLSQNKMGDSILNLQKSIETLHNIHSLDLNLQNNSLEQDQVKDIAKIFEKLQNITNLSLDFRQNGIDVRAAENLKKQTGIYCLSSKLKNFILNY